MNAPTAFESTGSKVLDDLAEVIGRKAALELAWAFRGERLYIPQNHHVEPRIAVAIGEKLAGKLSEALWRTTVAIPFGVMVRHRVLALADEGSLTRQEIAREACVSEARVYAILRARKTNDSQLSFL